MLDPQGIVTVDEQAVAATLGTAAGTATGPVMIQALRGFVDAGSTGETAAAHLVDELESTRVATFDVDQLLDYRSKRAPMTFDTDRWVAYDEPFLALDHVRDGDGNGFLLLHGVEPDLQWERAIAAVKGLVERFGVSLSVGFHGIPMGVPHTRPLTLTAHGTRAGLAEDYTSFFGTVKVPSSMSALLEYRLGEAGHDALGFVVHVPHYLGQSQFTPAAVLALQHVERATGLNLLTGRLAAAAADATAEIEKQVEESGEVRAVVRALEEQYDAFARHVGKPSLLADTAPIPTADELAAEFERYLRSRDDD